MTAFHASFSETLSLLSNATGKGFLRLSRSRKLPVRRRALRRAQSWYSLASFSTFQIASRTRIKSAKRVPLVSSETSVVGVFPKIGNVSNSEIDFRKIPPTGQSGSLFETRPILGESLQGGRQAK